MPMYECEACKFYTTRKTNYNLHLQTEKHARGGRTKEEIVREWTENTKTKYTCQSCSFTTGSPTRWARHLLSKEHKKHFRETIHVCPTPSCTKWTTFPEIMEEHRKTCNRSCFEHPIPDADDLPVLPGLMPATLHTEQVFNPKRFVADKKKQEALFRHELDKRYLIHPKPIQPIKEIGQAPIYQLLAFQIGDLVSLYRMDTNIVDILQDRYKQMMNPIHNRPLDVSALERAMDQLQTMESISRPIVVQPGVCVYKKAIQDDYQKIQAKALVEKWEQSATKDFLQLRLVQNSLSCIS